jgi:hypothetical protein
VNCRRYCSERGASGPPTTGRILGWSTSSRTGSVERPAGPSAPAMLHINQPLDRMGAGRAVMTSELRMPSPQGGYGPISVGTSVNVGRGGVVTGRFSSCGRPIGGVSLRNVTICDSAWNWPRRLISWVRARFEATWYDALVTAR